MKKFIFLKMKFFLFLFIFISLTWVLNECEGGVIQETFKNIEQNPSKKIVLFYFSTTDEGSVAQIILEELSEIVEKSHPEFLIMACDGSRKENEEEFRKASFSSPGVWWFSATMETGIVRFSLPPTVKNLVQHIESFYLPIEEDHVERFDNVIDFFDIIDQNEAQKPIFVKFYEEWCTHCKQFKSTFMRAATQWHDKLTFMEVECSKTKESKQFCDANGVNSFPKVFLFTAEKKIEMDSPDRSFLSVKLFLSNHVKYIDSKEPENETIEKEKVKLVEKKEVPQKVEKNDKNFEKRIEQLEKQVKEMQKIIRKHEMLLVDDEDDSNDNDSEDDDKENSHVLRRRKMASESK